MYEVVYVSSSVGLLDETTLTEILTTSRRNNARLDVTGMLLYRDGNIIQVLEGPKKDVLELIDCIARDPRHHQFLRLAEGEIAERSFPDWTMGFVHAGDLTDEQRDGLNEFLRVPIHERGLSVHASRAVRLLHTFRNAMR
jgi:hypothetical protein